MEAALALPAGPQRLEALQRRIEISGQIRIMRRRSGDAESKGRLELRYIQDRTTVLNRPDGPMLHEMYLVSMADDMWIGSVELLPYSRSEGIAK